MNRWPGPTSLALCLIITPHFLLTAYAEESPDSWYAQGRAVVAKAKKMKPMTHKARNVILFLGDGMGISTVTAARILDGQLRGEKGEENLLSFEYFPYTALIKTYNTNQQVADSAGTMSAIITGIKTKAGVLSVNQRVERGKYESAKGNRAKTMLELAEQKGIATGVVSTAAITHATPAACYAHSPDRDWESDAQLTHEARQAGFPDIARQLIEFPYGNGLEVVLGGGRRHFLPQSEQDPEHPAIFGARLDRRNLTDEWLTKPRSSYVWNAKQLDILDISQVDHVLGLFEPEHMQFACERSADPAGEPSLSDMTAKAIDLLQRFPKGYLLIVEAGRIDHAHHATNAYRALTDTIELSHAVAIARKKTDRNDTLIVVTADHSHVFTMGGYPIRGNPILGKVTEHHPRGMHQTRLAKDLDNHPYTTLGYHNGPITRQSAANGDLTYVDTTDTSYRQETAVHLWSETHGGEDVPLYADGPQAHLFHGVLDQHVIFHVVVEALGWNE